MAHHPSRSLTMPTSFDINVRLTDASIDPEVASFAGVYRVEFHDAFSETSDAEAAAMALATMRSAVQNEVPLGLRSAFELEAFDEAGVIVSPDPEHTAPEIPGYGLYDKLSNTPRADLRPAPSPALIPAPARPRRDGQYDYYTIEEKRGPGLPFVVYGWGTWPRSSVLAGQPMKQFLDSYETREDAEAVYPEASPGSQWTNPQNTFNHLPGENDPEPGGMYPDDWT